MTNSSSSHPQTTDLDFKFLVTLKQNSTWHGRVEVGGGCVNFMVLSIMPSSVFVFF